MSSKASDEGPSPSKIFELLDKMLESGKEWPDSCVAELIKGIDGALAQLAEKTKRKSKNETLNCKQNTPERFRDLVKSVGEKISKVSKYNIEVAIDVMDTIGHCHWAAVGLVLVASVLEKINTVKCNRKDCVELLQSMNDLAKMVMDVRHVPFQTENTRSKLKESLHKILEVAMSCWKTTKRQRLTRFLFAKKDQKKYQQLHQEIVELRDSLHMSISISTLIQVGNNEQECKGRKRSVREDEQEYEEVPKKRSRTNNDGDWNESSNPTQIISIRKDGGKILAKEKQRSLHESLKVTKGSNFKKTTK